MIYTIVGSPIDSPCGTAFETQEGVRVYPFLKSEWAECADPQLSDEEQNEDVVEVHCLQKVELDGELIDSSLIVWTL